MSRQSDNALPTHLINGNEINTVKWPFLRPTIMRASTIIFPNLAALRALDGQQNSENGGDNAHWRYGRYGLDISTQRVSQ